MGRGAPALGVRTGESRNGCLGQQRRAQGRPAGALEELREAPGHPTVPLHMHRCREVPKAGTGQPPSLGRSTGGVRPLDMPASQPQHPWLCPCAVPSRLLSIGSPGCPVRGDSGSGGRPPLAVDLLTLSPLRRSVPAPVTPSLVKTPESLMLTERQRSLRESTLNILESEIAVLAAAPALRTS